MEQELQDISKRLHDWDHSDRESGVITNIAEYAKHSNERAIYLIFGEAHDYSQAVKQHNSSSRENQLGLVMVAPINSRSKNATI